VRSLSVFQLLFLSQILLCIAIKKDVNGVLILSWPVLKLTPGCELHVSLCRSFLSRSCPKADFRTILNLSSGLRSFLMPTTTCTAMMQCLHVEENHLAQYRLQSLQLQCQNDQARRHLRSLCLHRDSRCQAQHDLVCVALCQCCF